MRQVLVGIRKFAIFCHRWMGLAFCVLFAWWFASGIFMMYWDFPGVGQGDRLDHSDPIDASRIHLSPEEAFARLGVEGSPSSVQLAMFDGRPVYRFGAGGGGRGGRGGRSGAPAARPGTVAGASGGGPVTGAQATSGEAGRGARPSGKGRGDSARGFGRGFGRRSDKEGRGAARGQRNGRGSPDGPTPPGAIQPLRDIPVREEGGAAGSGSSPAAAGKGPQSSPPDVVASATPPPPPSRRRGGRGGGGQTMVYADDGSVQTEYSKDLLLRIASHWAGQPPSSAHVQEVTAVDQWTVQGGLRSQMPLWKYTFPDGQQVYMNQRSGEVVQYTTLGSRIGAELGPIPHWIYYTPLRVRQKLWSNLIIYTSGIGTVAALMGLIIGISLYSPNKRYRFEGAPSGIPYAGQKRLHMTLGLFFGIVTCTWAFSGMLSMDPFPVQTNRGPNGGQGGDGRITSPLGRIQAVLRARRFQIEDYAAKSPQIALVQLGNMKVKQLDFTSFDDEPVYFAAIDSRQTRIVPVEGSPRTEYDKDRIFDMVSNAAHPYDVVDKHVLTQYDRYYLDRHRERPLPVLFVKLNDPQHTQLYIDQRTGRVVGEHSDASSFMTRWLYHGLHSMDFPWLYNYRSAWDIVVLTLMLGGLWLCVTSVQLGWSLVRRKLGFTGRNRSSELRLETDGGVQDAGAAAD
ncbi:MAG TPA: hypothetical protein VIY49_13860 [Bryobacteraceae bacterium]